MAKVPRYTYNNFYVQGNYGYGHGWEDLCGEDSRIKGYKRLREYRKNELGVPFRLIQRREPNPEWVDETEN